MAARRVARHPVALVVLVALVVRIGAAVASHIAGDGSVLIRDEATYIGVAAAVADGDAASYEGPYGQAVYESRRAFLMPLAFLYKVFGPSRLAGQLLAAGFGAIAAGLATILALRVMRRTAAIAVGLTIALWPSQVLWSSVVLRESMVWVALGTVAVAVGYAYTTSGRRSTLAALAAALALFCLGALRDHTMVVAAWALLVSAGVAVVRSKDVTRAWRTAVPVAASALLIPLAFGLGPGGARLAVAAADSLAVTRAYLATDADSRIHAPEEYDGPAISHPGRRETSGALNLAERDPPRTEDGARVIHGHDDVTFQARDGFWVNLRHIPRGIAGVLLRPSPWEETGKNQVRLARAESILWGALYPLAAAGLVAGWRRLEWLAFPVSFAVGFALVGSLTQGNVGTAFRHRGQILFVLVILTGLAVERRLASRKGAPR